jgi:hypothetical protein
VGSRIAFEWVIRKGLTVKKKASVARQSSRVPSWKQLVALIDEAGSARISGSKRRSWTKRMLSHINKVCPTPLVACPSWKGTSSKGAYLLDLVWSREPKERPGQSQYPWHKCRGLALALECEWGGTRTAFWEDFVKLADVRADRSVFTGNLWPDEGFTDFRVGKGKFISQIQAFLEHHACGRDYEVLVALWNKKNEDEFVARVFNGKGENECLRSSPRAG